MGIRHAFKRSFNITVENIRRRIYAMSNPQKTAPEPAPESAAESTSTTPADSVQSDIQYSGETLLKMPKTMHRKLAEAAEKEGVDLNQYLLTLLSEQSAVGQVQYKLDELSRKLAREESLAYSRERTTPYSTTPYNRYVEDIESGIDD